MRNRTGRKYARRSATCRGAGGRCRARCSGLSNSWRHNRLSSGKLRTRKRLMMVALCSGILSTPYRWEWKSKKSMMIFPVLEELGIGFVAFSPLANGLLSGYYTENDRFDAANDYRASMPQFQKESFGQNKALFTLLDEFWQSRNMPRPRKSPLPG